MKPVLDISKASIFFNGTFSEPRLNHPECIAIDAAGNIWCGGEEGEIFRIACDGSRVELIGKTGGFALGIALDSSGFVYLCDMKFGSVFRLDPRKKTLTEFARGMACPNYPLVDERNGFLYVSDSQMSGPGVWRFRLDTGEGELWFGEDCVFANGLAMSADGSWLYVAETFAGRISRIPIGSDGSAGPKELVVTNPVMVPDGLTFDRKGRLYISCYEPSSIYRLEPGGELELLIHDRQCLTLDRPTNMAFRADHELFCANIAVNHISVIDLR